MYEVEVRISLPNVMDTAAPAVHRVCYGEADFTNGSAFAIKSDNPLSRCALSDLETRSDVVTFSIVCAGPNRGFAQSRFELSPAGFRGVHFMNMGGKNMTMTEMQKATRLSDCPTNGKPLSNDGESR